MRAAVVTGASRGIGAATAARLASTGWHVIDVSRSTGVDLTTEPLWDTLVRTNPQAIVCAAGTVEPRPLTTIPRRDWIDSFTLHVMQAVDAVTWAISSKFTGPVVLVGSTAGTRPSPGWAAYSATKAALHNVGLTAAVEGAAHGVRVYVVAPGRCATGLRARLAPDEDPDTIMQPDEVATVITHCIDDVAGVLAGQVLEVARRG